jgi:hypothetical protein
MPPGFTATAAIRPPLPRLQERWFGVIWTRCRYDFSTRELDVLRGRHDLKEHAVERQRTQLASSATLGREAALVRRVLMLSGVSVTA